MKDLRNHEFNSLKILHHVDRLRTLARGGDIAPVTVEIDPVAYCNHACEWCVDPAHHSARMSVATFDSLIAELSQFRVNGFGVEGVVFKGGGEPTLHPEFGRMVEGAAGHGFGIGVVTNGSRLVEWADVLATHASYVRISIDGPTAESHARVHKSRDFDKIIEGTRKLVAARADKRHPIVGLSFAMDADTVELTGEAIALGEALGVDYVLMRPPFFEEVGSQPTMTISQAQDVRRRLNQAALSYAGRLEVMVGNWIGDAEQKAIGAQRLEASGRRDQHVGSQLPIEHRTGRCLASPVLAVITADGHVYGCCNLRALPDWSFGQIDYDKGIGFGSLWDGELREKALSRMHRTDCIKHCTHPLARYNEMIEVLREEPMHAEFV